MAEQIPDLDAAVRRFEEMRLEIHREVNSLFAILIDQAEGDRMEGLVKLASAFQEQRDKARAELEFVKEELKGTRAEVRRLRAQPGGAQQQVDMLNLVTAARTFVEAVRIQVNTPTTSRDQLQGALLNALQAWDKTGGKYV